MVESNIINVNCYSGYTYAERPASFWWRGKKHEVEAVVQEWREPGERHFRVRTGDNKLVQLCYNETDDYWSIIELAGD